VQWSETLCLSISLLLFRLLSFQQYPYCDSWALSWPYRRAIILRELEEMQGDVVCLQEVQADYYEQHISPFMSELGYDGLFKQKSRDFTGSYVKVRLLHLDLYILTIFYA
jgi:CCR4-NOT transcription complex subunit 6